MLSFSRGGNGRLAIIGLDCATPQLVFDKWLDALPNIKSLVEGGAHGKLRSTVPPITVPAWMSMMTSKDPGTLGFYGFRNRKDYSYDALYFANSQAVKEDTVWDILSRAGKKVILLGVPQTYPPKPVNGSMVTCFLTPNASCQYTYPPELKREVEATVGEYKFDVDNFRSDERDRILQDIYEMTEKRFKLARHFLKTKPWDFFMMVEMGIDRIHHGFWKFFDPEHPKHEPGNKYEGAILDYYRYVDGEVGKLLALFDDKTTVLVVSDHGAQKMDGGICINEWLIKEGYLALAEPPDGVIPIGKAKIDWSGSMAWGEGGYYSRIFMNVKGREPNGAVDPADYHRVRDELKEKLEGITDDKGRNIGTVVFKPEEVYSRCNGVPPDLIVYFGNLSWRSVGSVGLNAIHTFDNDTGPDDANHAQHGIFIMAGPKIPGRCRLENLDIKDVAPTVLSAMGLKAPHDMQGNTIVF